MTKAKKNIIAPVLIIFLGLTASDTILGQEKKAPNKAVGQYYTIVIPPKAKDFKVSLPTVCMNFERDIPESGEGFKYNANDAPVTLKYLNQIYTELLENSDIYYHLIPVNYDVINTEKYLKIENSKKLRLRYLKVSRRMKSNLSINELYDIAKEMDNIRIGLNTPVSMKKGDKLIPVNSEAEKLIMLKSLIKDSFQWAVWLSSEKFRKQQEESTDNETTRTQKFFANLMYEAALQISENNKGK